jgi:hypothetical protein
MMTAENIAHRDLVDVVAQVCQGALDTAIPPGGMLCGHADDELLAFIRDAGPTQFVACVAAVKLFCNQALIPSHKRIGDSEGGERFEACAAQGMGKGSETVSFSIGAAYGLVAQFRFEKAVFFLEGGDDLLLVAIEPAGDHSDEDVEYKSRSLG